MENWNEKATYSAEKGSLQVLDEGMRHGLRLQCRTCSSWMDSVGEELFY